MWQGEKTAWQGEKWCSGGGGGHGMERETAQHGERNGTAWREKWNGMERETTWHGERNSKAWREKQQGRESVNGTAGEGKWCGREMGYYVASWRFLNENVVWQCHDRQ